MDTLDFEHNSYTQRDLNFSDTLHVQLRRIWLNEQHSPELLMFQKDIINEVLHQIDIQQEKISRSPQTVDDKFIFSLFQMEIDRMKYFLVSYLRIRILKIEKWCSYLLSNENERNKLSEKELEYAKGYNEILSTLFKETLLNELPEKLQSLNEQTPVVNMMPQPNLNTHVICRVIEPVENFVLDSQRNDKITLGKGDIYAVRYQCVRELLLRNKIELI